MGKTLEKQPLPLFVYTLLNLASYYDWSVLPLSVMGFHKKKVVIWGWVGGWVSSIQFYFGFELCKAANTWWTTNASVRPAAGEPTAERLRYLGNILRLHDSRVVRRAPMVFIEAGAHYTRGCQTIPYKDTETFAQRLAA